ncbi:MAG TPA: hypothetical protein VI752_01805 [Candidatus Paceibacterota bacterium]
MSAAAVERLRQLWEKLTFAQIKRVVAKEPEDILFISIRRKGGHTEYLKSNRTADIPKADRDQATISWRHYFGFTKGDIYFQQSDYCELDCDIDLTMDWGRLGNHHNGFEKPEMRVLICGEVMKRTKGDRFNKWFVCPPEFKFLVDIVLNGTTLTEAELRPKLETSRYPDKYWAIARLVLFDNVQAFVDDCKYKRWEGSEEQDKMWLPKATAQYIHEMSHQLNTPMWWEEFKRLAAEQGVDHDHPASGGFCYACKAERADEDYYYSRDYCDY